MNVSQVLHPAANDAVERFEFPRVDGAVVEHVQGGSMPTAREVEEIHRQAYAEGHANGLRDGYAEGQKRAAGELSRRTKALDSLLTQLARPLEALDDEVVDHMGELVMLIARHLVRRELHTAPGEIVAVVRETLKQLPLSSRMVAIHLHPEDVDIVRAAMTAGAEDGGWRLEADPLLSRGGLRIESESSRIDATLESRLAAVAAQMFGGERQEDEPAS